jgi:hypothetical protein
MEPPPYSYPMYDGSEDDEQDDDDTDPPFTRQAGVLQPLPEVTREHLTLWREQYPAVELYEFPVATAADIMREEYRGLRRDAHLLVYGNYGEVDVALAEEEHDHEEELVQEWGL